MKSLTNHAKPLFLAIMLVSFFPLAMTAGSDIKFADLKLDDIMQGKLPLQKDNIMVSFEKEKCTFNSEQNTLSFPKGACITVKSENGDNITGIRLVVSNDDGKDSATGSKKKKPETIETSNDFRLSPGPSDWI